MLIVCIEDLDRIDDIQTTELSQQKIFFSPTHPSGFVGTPGF